MRVLLVESTPGNAHEVADWLTEAGHEAMSCFGSPVTFGCRGVEHHEDCPLDRHTDAALLVRDLDGGGHTLTEMGAVCAMRHRVPVVEMSEPTGVGLDATMLSVLEEVQHHTANQAYVQAALEALVRIPGIGDLSRIGITVNRQQDRVHALLALPPDIEDGQVPMLVDWVGRALRAHDHYAKVIDVGVRR
jgi:hypothetical protein